MTAVLVALIVLVGLVVALLAASVRVLREYERAVVFRLGRLLGQRGPGLILLVPGIDRMVRVSLRTVTLNIPPQNVITCDNVPGARRRRRLLPRRRPQRVGGRDRGRASRRRRRSRRPPCAPCWARPTSTRCCPQRERLNEDLQQIIDEQTEPWGIKVSTVEIKDVGIPTTMQRAMARQAEAERERRAKVIHAEGEFQAAAKLTEAAEVIGRAPAALQLRYLQTLSEIGTEQNSTIVFPLPLDMIKPLLSAARDGHGAARRGRRAARAAAAGELPRAARRRPRCGPVARATALRADALPS